MSANPQDVSSGIAASSGMASTGAAASSAVASSGAQIWPDKWRAFMVEGSTAAEQEEKQLERYQSPKDIWNKARSLEQKLSSGDYKRPPPDNATEDELKEWRQEQGIPATPADYTITMPAGYDKEPPPEDDEFLNAVRNVAHTSHVPQSVFDGFVATFYDQVAQQEEAITDADNKASEACEESLRQEWGNQDYKLNKAMAQALLSRAPAGFNDQFMNGRLGDGTLIKNSPQAWQWLVQLEREINPTSTVLPGATGDLGKSVDTEIAEIEKQMGNRQSDYWKGPKNAQGETALQVRYRELLDAREKLNQRKTA